MNKDDNDTVPLEEGDEDKDEGDGGGGDGDDGVSNTSNEKASSLHGGPSLEEGEKAGDSIISKGGGGDRQGGQGQGGRRRGMTMIEQVKSVFMVVKDSASFTRSERIPWFFKHLIFPHISFQVFFSFSFSFSFFLFLNLSLL